MKEIICNHCGAVGHVSSRKKMKSYECPSCGLTSLFSDNKSKDQSMYTDSITRRQYEFLLSLGAAESDIKDLTKMEASNLISYKLDEKKYAEYRENEISEEYQSNEHSFSQKYSGGKSLKRYGCLVVVSVILAIVISTCISNNHPNSNLKTKTINTELQHKEKCYICNKYTFNCTKIDINGKEEYICADCMKSMNE